MYQLRDYQQRASDAATAFFQNRNDSKNAIIVLPTGSGKSLVIADIASRLDAPTLIFQPSKEILEQNFAKLQSYGIWDCSVYSASFNSKEIPTMSLSLYYQMVGRAIRPHKYKPEAWIVDLCNNYWRFGRVEDLMLTERQKGIYQIETNGKTLTNVYF